MLLIHSYEMHMGMCRLLHYLKPCFTPERCGRNCCILLVVLSCGSWLCYGAVPA